MPRTADYFTTTPLQDAPGGRICESEIRTALAAHAKGGRPPRELIARILARATPDPLAVVLKPGASASRPNYAMEVSAIGLTIERTSVRLVAERLAQIVATLDRIAEAAPDAAARDRLWIASNHKGVLRVRAPSIEAARETLEAFGPARYFTLMAPCSLDDFADAIERAITWFEDPSKIDDPDLALARALPALCARAERRLCGLVEEIGSDPGQEVRARIPLDQGLPATAWSSAKGSAHAAISHRRAAHRAAALIEADRAILPAQGRHNPLAIEVAVTATALSHDARAVLFDGAALPAGAHPLYHGIDALKSAGNLAARLHMICGPRLKAWRARLAERCILGRRHLRGPTLAAAIYAAASDADCDPLRALHMAAQDLAAARRGTDRIDPILAEEAEAPASATE